MREKLSGQKPVRLQQNSMAKINHNLSLAEKRKRRVRAKLHGTASRPRLVVHRTNKYTYLQVIDDVANKTLVAASDMEQRRASKKSDNLTKTQTAQEAAGKLVELLKKSKIKAVVFDRGSYRYHGRVKAVAEEVRNLGIKV
jgi:large subunit ribosomal protein L18